MAKRLTDALAHVAQQLPYGFVVRIGPARSRADRLGAVDESRTDALLPDVVAQFDDTMDIGASTEMALICSVPPDVDHLIRVT